MSRSAYARVVLAFVVEIAALLAATVGGSIWWRAQRGVSRWLGVVPVAAYVLTQASLHLLTDVDTFAPAYPWALGAMGLAGVAGVALGVRGARPDGS